MCLAQGHNAVTPVRLNPAVPRSRVKHSTTQPLHSDLIYNETCLKRPQKDKTKLLKSCGSLMQVKSTVKPVLSGHLKEDQKLVFKND